MLVPPPTRVKGDLAGGLGGSFYRELKVFTEPALATFIESDWRRSETWRIYIAAFIFASVSSYEDVAWKGSRCDINILIFVVKRVTLLLASSIN